MDRRIKSRIDVQLTCHVGAGKVKAEPVRAFTENVSRTGMLMRWAEGVPLPNIDGKLVLDLQLPENSEFGPRVMRCRTQVLRVTPCESWACALSRVSAGSYRAIWLECPWLRVG
jgi:c-di-GMP-binding flagellar brake protein YcgR